MKKFILFFISVLLFADTKIFIYPKNVAFIKQDKNIALEDGVGYIENIPRNIILDSIYFDKNVNSFYFKNGRLYIKTEKSDFLKTKISYLTKGISYKISYVGKLDKKLQLIGYCQISNNSKIFYNNADISFIAGEFNINFKLPIYIYKRAKALTYENMPNRIEGYYRYDFPFKIDLEPNSIRINKFLNKKVDYKKIYSLEVFDSLSRFGQKVFKFDQIISFNTPLSLPAGVIRFYKDTFLGENFIKNSPKNSYLNLKIGKDFDISLKRVQKEYNKTKKFVYTKIKFIIKNPKDKDINLQIKDFFPNSNAKIRADIKYKKLDANTIIYNVKVPKKSKIEFTASYKVLQQNI
ncbi:hypothetical protein [Nitrosophilus kaiyonis]|uniref:hypothetical protein n=1 Tax=Nitrosophilus kaiyonis TaxID=2930200 RepID=UPI0024914C49|nr:hypothetical protein [Nitrosophilus kaiyonis]